MKKIVLFLLSITFLFAHSVAKGDEKLSDVLKKDKSATLAYETEFNIHPSLPVYRFHLTRKPEADLKEEFGEIVVESIEVSKKGDPSSIQTLEVDQELPSREFDSSFVAEDINFDGYKDISLLSSWGATGNSTFRYWLFDKDTGLFVLNQKLSELVNPVPNPETQEITTKWIGGKMGTIYTEETYKFENGRLVLVREESQDWVDEKGHFLKVIKERKDGEMKVVSEEVVREEEMW